MTERTVTLPTIFPLTEDDALPREGAVTAEWFEKMQREGMTPFHIAERLSGFGRHTEALSILQTEISRDTDDKTRARCYMLAGQIREWSGRFDAAARFYEAASALGPPDPPNRYFAPNNLGYCLNRLGRHAEAEAWCRRAIEVDPTRFNAHKNLGIALESTGRPAEAAVAYRDAARAMPKDDRALRRLRILLVNHPEVARDKPDLVDEVETLLKTSRGHRSELRPVDKGPSEEDVRRLLQDVRVVEEINADGFQVFGLFWGSPKELDYSTLDDALAGGTLEVTEISEVGQVPNLKVSNRSDTRVLLMAGEQLVGAKQNRVLNASTVVGARIDMTLPVTCVEQGRWAYRSRRFETSGTSSHAALRFMMTKQVYDSYRQDGKPRADQGHVWQEVARKLKASASSSPSAALHDAYETLEGRLDDVRQRITPGERWSGAVFASGGTILGLDLFDRPSTLAKLWPKLIRAYAIDSFEKNSTAKVSRDHVEDWVRGLTRTAVEVFPSSGLGADARLEGHDLIGALLIVEGVPVHLEAFVDDND